MSVVGEVVGKGEVGRRKLGVRRIKDGFRSLFVYGVERVESKVISVNVYFRGIFRGGYYFGVFVLVIFF